MKKFCLLLVFVLFFVMCPLSSFASDEYQFNGTYFYPYNPMEDTEIFELLNAAPLAPEGGGVLPQLSGKTYEIKNAQGLAIDLTFDAEGAGISFSAEIPPTTALRLVEFESEYAGLALGDFVIVGFRVPDSARAWAIVLNLKSGLAAAYEVFFAYTPASRPGSPPTPSRDAQRNVWVGYVEGIGSSEVVPTATNRLTGKVVLWENDLGSFYTNYGTRSWSAFYPLGQPEGLVGSWTAPSDYYDFQDARHYLYSRTESVYSGATLVELLDLFLVSQIGLKIGFDADDELEFTLYSGNGKILGSYAAYGGFASAEQTGGRSTYRPNGEKLTQDQVIEAIEDAGSWSGAFAGAGKIMYPLSDKLDGKSFSLVFDDGLTLEYQIIGKNEDTGTYEMRFRDPRDERAQDWKTGRFEAFEVDANLIFFTHAIDDAFPDKIYLNVVDFDNGLATCMNSDILEDETFPRLCVPSFHFGVINMEGITPVSQRHGFTKDLLGRSFTWTYNSSMVSQHYYSTPNSYYYSIMGTNGESYIMWSSDAFYVKFRDNVFLISWLETYSSGQNDSKIFNLNTMHDVGVCYGIPDGAPFEYNTYGSQARHAGTVDVSSIYGNEQATTEYTITFDANGGTVTPASITTGTDGKLASLPTPTKGDDTFIGWFTALIGGDEVTADTVFDDDATIYAQWESGGDEEIAIEGVTLTPAAVTINTGLTKQLTAAIVPANATEAYEVAWKSSNADIVTVAAIEGDDLKAVVTAVAASEDPVTITVTVTTDNEEEFSTECAVTVIQKIDVESVALDKTVLPLTVGAASQLEPTVSPAGATIKDVTWSSSEESVATVVNGLVTAHKTGTATITVTTVDGGKTATCTVTVTPASTTTTTTGSSGGSGTIPGGGSTAPSTTTDITGSSTPLSDQLAWFQDVNAGDWFYNNVSYVYQNNLMNGTSASPMLFSPNAPLTRGMIVTILYRQAGSPSVSGLANPFSDVPGGQWYTDAVIWAAENDIVLGIGDGLYAPEVDVTMEQLSAILYRYAQFLGEAPAGSLDGALAFADAASIADYAKDAALFCSNNGIITGKPGNLFDPQGNATRAEAAAMLNRFIESVAAVSPEQPMDVTPPENDDEGESGDEGDTSDTDDSDDAEGSEE